MKIILKILFAPVIAVLAVTTYLFAFLLSLSSIIFGIAGTVLGILGVIVLLTGNITNGIIVLIIAFLVSPLGVPMFAAWLVGRLQSLRYGIQDKIYG